MKKLIVMLAVLGAGLSGALAQGTVSFANSAGTPVVLEASGVNAPTSDVMVGLYWRPDASTEFTLVPATANLVADGIFVAGTRTIDAVAPGTVVDLQVRAWSVGYANYEEAFATGSLDVFEGTSIIMNMALGGGTLPTPSLVNNGGLESFGVRPVPEPSTMVLAALGIAGIFLFRRRK